MLILHISDIHFRYPECATPDLDPDRPYRTRLIQDVRTRVKALGCAVDAILVGGDIAFRGATAEYDAAIIWLYELADACGCKRERIFVIPGNHDIDRDVVIKDPAVRNVQQAIIRAGNPERELAVQFRHKQTGDALLAPAAGYNAFAARFSCQVYTPDRLYWHQDLPLDATTKLRIYGLTSTLLSGAWAPKDDPKPGLYLSPLQTVLDPVDNVVNLVMCHHPPDWFIDCDDIVDAISGRAAVHVFGHKHRQRIQRDPRYIVFSAGAVNPDRNEKGWEPGYNLFSLTLGQADKGHHLDVEAHLLCWQTNPDQYRPKQDQDGQEVFRHRIALQNIIAVAGAPCKGSAAAAVAAPVDAEAAMGDERTRNIVLRFWSLASSQRREISQKLDLLEEGEMDLLEPERYGRALMRAGERKLLGNLADEIERMEKR
jgi:predicted phosphodiesterase